VNNDVSRLIKNGESETVEFLSGSTRPDTVARTVCAMLNQQGGVIVWGVDDSGEVTGVEDADARVQELHKVIAQAVTPLPLFSATARPVARQEVIVVEVPRGADKPYSVSREIWVRVGQSTLRASTDQSAELVQLSASTLERWEREPLPGFSIEDCDRNELATAKSEITRAGRFGIEVPADDEELLRRLGMEHRGQFTNAAVVLFAKSPRSWAPNLALRIVAYADDKSGPIGNDTIVEGPAIRVLKEAVTIVQQRTGFSGEFQGGRLERKDYPAYPLFALREGLVNAMVHRDYTVIGGGVSIEILPSRLVVRNPGKLPEGWTPADLKKNHESRPKNPDIARVFYLRELMEQLGMGTQKMIAECKAIGSKAPAWKVEQGSVSLTLFRAPEPDVEIDLSERQLAFLKSTRPGGEYKPSDYIKITGISERQARRELSELQRFGLLKKRGKGPATAYARTEKKAPR
jgi:ATP-dependent DNA helicase RecG